MKSSFLKLLMATFLLIQTFCYGQRFGEYNTWSFSGGVNSTFLYGDLNNVTTDGDVFFQNGFYVYVDKMFNPVIGIELKGQYLKLGAAGALTQNEIPVSIVTIANEKNIKSFRSKGSGFGTELNFIINLSNLNVVYRKRDRKWNWAGHLGLGFHSYKNTLESYVGNQKLLDIDRSQSIYYAAALGAKYKLNHQFDFEIRPALNINAKDDLDGAISSRQGWETFFLLNIGVIFKHGKEKEHAVWKDQLFNEPQNVVASNNSTDNTIEKVETRIDSDGDGLFDEEDACPFQRGVLSNKGCPELRDTDGDGIADIEDICPKIKGLVSRQGCPDMEINNIIESMILALSEKIKFIDDNIIDPNSYRSLNEISDIMKSYRATNFNIEGHTDHSQEASQSLFLSLRRAKSIKKYLIKRGISPYRIITSGYGDTRPLYTEAEKEIENNRIIIKRAIKSDLIVPGKEIIDPTEVTQDKSDTKK